MLPVTGDRWWAAVVGLESPAVQRKAVREIAAFHEHQQLSRSFVTVQ